MVYPWEFANTTTGKVLKAIRVRGKARIKDVAADLGVTASAVRQHLAQLEAQGTVQAEKVYEGIGRPYYVYSVTAQANSLFHKDCGELTGLLLEEFVRTQGSEALQRVLQRVGDRLTLLYQRQIWGRELADRVQAWAELLEERGVFVEIEKSDSGYILKEYGCPYYDVAVGSRAVCEMELRVMSRLLETEVKLVQCTWDGCHYCQFLIVQEDAEN